MIILAEDIVSLGKNWVISVAPDVSGKYKRRRGIETGKETAIKLTEEVVLNNLLGNMLQGSANTAGTNPSLGILSGVVPNVDNSSSLNKPRGETVTYISNTSNTNQPAQPNFVIDNHSSGGEVVTYETQQPASNSQSQSQIKIQ